MKRMKKSSPANREADDSSSIEGIRRGLVEAKKSLGRSADEVSDALERDAGHKFISAAARRILERSEW
jgi:hypothetical protein